MHNVYDRDILSRKPVVPNTELKIKDIPISFFVILI
jgi:hypothetical protein